MHTARIKYEFAEQCVKYNLPYIINYISLIVKEK